MIDPIPKPQRFMAALICSGLCACQSGDFPVYNELEGLRVLAVRSTPPAILPGQQATLDAFVFDESDQLDDVRYRWSFCPARLPASQGGECALDEDELADLTGLDLDFDLGEEPTATLEHSLPPPLLQALCNGTDSNPDDGGAQGFVLDCEQGLPLSVELVVEQGGDRIRSFKEVRLLLDDTDPELNPQIDDLLFVEVPREIDDMDIEDEISEDDAEPVAEDGSTEFELPKRIRLFADVPESATERFMRPARGFETEGKEKLENLAITWFVSSGSTEKERTAFTDGTSELSAIRANTWRLPFPRDEDRDEAQVVLVIRDERGGVNWLQRSVELSR